MHRFSEVNSDTHNFIHIHFLIVCSIGENNVDWFFFYKLTQIWKMVTPLQHVEQYCDKQSVMHFFLLQKCCSTRYNY